MWDARKIWNAEYGKGSRQHYNKYPSEIVVSWVNKNFPTADGMCLDVGCGNGNNLRFLLDYGFDAYGVDVSDLIISKIENEFRDRVSCQEAESMNFSDDTFSVVIDRGSLQHSSDLRAALRECARVLKAGGRMFSSMLSEGANPLGHHKFDSDERLALFEEFFSVVNVTTITRDDMSTGARKIIYNYDLLKT